MNNKKEALYKAKARIIKAMAHPTRLLIVDELSRSERCVYELREMVGNDVSTISKHLSILKDAGLVTDDKRGTQVYYTLRCPCIMNFFKCVETVLQITAEEQMSLIK